MTTLKYILLGLLIIGGCRISVADEIQNRISKLKQSAEKGNPAAQWALGRRYRNGRGVPKDDKQAAKWFRQAADQGDAMAQYTLGYMCENGQGIPQDYRQAAKLFQRAAAQGHADAQSRLGAMYYKGRGVSQN